MSLDVAAYLTRIGYQGSADSIPSSRRSVLPEPTLPEPTLSTLHALVAAHNRSIPFENLDPLLGIPVADLSAPALADKMVRAGRGGYCYEHNGLLGYLLERLGYGVHRLAARVVWMSAPDAPPAAQTHTMLSVAVPGVDGRFLVDVGFGGQTPSAPIRMQAGPVQQTRHEPYRLVTHDGGYRLEAQVRDRWQPLYVFTTEPRPQIDLEVGSWYVSTQPKSIFVVGLSAALVTDEARWNLRGRNLAIHGAGGSEQIRLATAADVLNELTGRFGINLQQLAGMDVEARVSQVLDS